MKSYIFSILLLFSACILFISCDSVSKEERERIKREKEEKIIRDSVENAQSNQYIMGEHFTGNKTQIIDLMKGPVTFIIEHEGNGNFKATLTTTDARPKFVIHEGTGNFKVTKSFEVDSTSAYLIDVETGGRWSIIRK